MYLNHFLYQFLYVQDDFEPVQLFFEWSIVGGQNKIIFSVKKNQKEIISNNLWTKIGNTGHSGYRVGYAVD